MTVPLIVLAVLSAVGGFVGVPYALSGGAIHNYFEETLEPVAAHAPVRGAADAHGAVTPSGEPARSAAADTHAAPAATDSHAAPAGSHEAGASPLSVGEGRQGEPAHERAHDPQEVSMERLFTAISVGIGLLGIVVGWLVFSKRPLLVMPRLLENKYYVDEAYNAGLINPIKSASREVLWKLFDVKVIDWTVNAVGRGMAQMGTLVRYLQPGFVRSYAAIILIGALAVVGYFAYEAFRHLR
jgi:NADH-quinone oxidoreductase subunit L